MKIKWNKPPVAGERFYFTIEQRVGNVKAELYLDNELLYTAEECPDPPCHEVFFIPPETFDKSLILKVNDSSGDTFVKNFKIKKDFI